MQKQFTVVKGCPYPLGVSRDESGINISVALKGKSGGIILYDSHKKKIGQLELDSAQRMGALYYARILWEEKEELFYQLYEDGQIVFDTHMKKYSGHERFGQKIEAKDVYGRLSCEEYDWEEDINPKLSYENSVMYCMHVRGFTRHASSNVTGRGTFQGVQEKISYLKELGITTLELMPVYEFLEKQKETLNYWGFMEGFYYAPKNSYAFSGCGDTEFKDLIKALHHEGMEAVLQFYFPKTVSQSEILSVLRYWKMEYHVDGFHLKGENIPLLLLGQEPALADTKMFYYEFPVDALYPGETPLPYRNLAVYKDDYLYTMRRFLKGDEDMLKAVLKCMRTQPPKEGQINFLSNYYGFTLADMVAYERRHNEANGEDNKDGNAYNHTWNCGVEGKSRKKAIVSLRQRQLRNALCLLFFSQGTPLLFMGDEFGNSQNGNNNPYGLDNEVSWLNWKNLEQNRELYEFVRTLISLRKNHPILHVGKELRLMDYISCGYPDLSYHAAKAWQPDMSNYSRNIGLMYCGKYAKLDSKEEDVFFYLAINMHWEPHEFALPKLPKGENWHVLLDTLDWAVTEKAGPKLADQQTSVVEERSIQVYISKKGNGK